MRRIVLLFALLVVSPQHALAQECNQLALHHEYDIAADCRGVSMTMRHDAARPFLYIASKEAGLKIYDVSGAPRLVKTIPTAALHALDVMNVSQTGSNLYLALGNHFSKNQSSGFAIVNIADPADAAVIAVWSDPALKGGAGVIEAVGDVVYLGAMMNGLMIFDVSDPGQIGLLSRFVPDISYPDRRPDPLKFNARGLVVRGDLAYVSYDAGGVRIIDVADKRHPREAGWFSNPKMNNRPRAYNNAVVDGELLYVTVDYCGMEVLNVADPAKISLVSWWNPWRCETSGFNWFTSPGHANEIAFDREAKLMFISTGKSDLHCVSVANPSAPALCKVFGGPSNGIGTWGVSVHENRVYLSYICTLGIPFASNWSGVKVLTFKE